MIGGPGTNPSICNAIFEFDRKSGEIQTWVRRVGPHLHLILIDLRDFKLANVAYIKCHIKGILIIDILG